MSELIDTLWNVNVPALPQPLRCAEELIDTLWNVNNISEETLVGTITRINRYIMECK